MVKKSDSNIEKIQEKAQDATVSKQIRKKRTYYIEIILITLFAAFAFLAFLARSIPYFSIDLTITHAIQKFQNPFFAALMEGVSWIGFGPQIYIFIRALYNANKKKGKSVKAANS